MRVRADAYTTVQAARTLGGRSAMEYVTNERGERIRVLLEIEEYERLLEIEEELEDIRESEMVLSRLESGEEERIPWEESKRRRRG